VICKPKDLQTAKKLHFS